MSKTERLTKAHQYYFLPHYQPLNFFPMFSRRSSIEYSHRRMMLNGIETIEQYPDDVPIGHNVTLPIKGHKFTSED